MKIYKGGIAHIQCSCGACFPQHAMFTNCSGCPAAFGSDGNELPYTYEEYEKDARQQPNIDGWTTAAATERIKEKKKKVADAMKAIEDAEQVYNQHVNSNAHPSVIAAAKIELNIKFNRLAKVVEENGGQEMVFKLFKKD